MRIRQVFSALGGALATSWPVPFIIADAWAGDLLPISFLMAGSVLTSATLLAGGIGLLLGAWWGRVSGSVGIVGVVALMSPFFFGHPGPTLALLVPALLAIFVLWSSRSSLKAVRLELETALSSRARGSIAAACGVGLVVYYYREFLSLPLIVPWLAGSLVLTLAFQAHWVATHWRRYPGRALLMLSSLTMGAIGVASSSSNWPTSIVFSLVALAFCAFVLPWAEAAGSLDRAADWWEPVFGHPERLLVTTFFLLCFGGSLLLALPPSAASGKGIEFIDAAFTSVSAVCVTGLIVLDTPVAFSGFGQVAILLLIQLGGLGIMTFSTVAFRLFGRRMSLRHEGVVARLLSSQDRSRLFGTARDILVVTFASEAVGTVLLTGRFLLYQDGFGQALWRGIFTSVSAFCNAGFALQSTNLMPYQKDPWVLHIVGFLIILGGLSPLAVLCLPGFFRRHAGPISTQVKLILASTGGLLLIGFFTILAAEWSNQLADLGFWDRLHNAWFQSVTTRTAGFNSIDFAALSPVTITTMIVLMFIGGSPGGTAGGIKTTTLAVLLLSVVAALRGRWAIEVYGRRIPHITLYKATAILVAGMASVLAGFLGLLMTQRIAPDLAIFEVVSALGTVGLSIGATPLLDDIGKIIIIACMFAGRVGPLTVFMFLGQKSQEERWVRPEEEVDVG